MYPAETHGTETQTRLTHPFHVSECQPLPDGAATGECGGQEISAAFPRRGGRGEHSHQQT